MPGRLALPLTGISLLCALTACSVIEGNAEAEPTSGSVTSVAPPTTEPTESSSAGPETTPAVPTPVHSTSISDPSLLTEEEADRKREGIYTDEWVENVSIYLQREANTYIATGEPSSERDIPINPGSLNSLLDYLVRNEVPEGFNATFETTESENFIIKVWHPAAYTYYTEATALDGRSDPLTESTPPTEKALTPREEIDASTTKMLYRTVVVIGEYQRTNNGETPTDEYLRKQGVILDGWEWSIDQSPTTPEHRIVRLWQPEGELYNSEKNAAYRDSFPKEDFRPDYNFDVDPLFPIIDAPLNLGGKPSSTPSPGSAGSGTLTPSPTPVPFPTRSDDPA